MVGAAEGAIIAIIMTHHIATISAQTDGSHAAGAIAIPPACWCGKGAREVMSQALMPRPAPVNR